MLVLLPLSTPATAAPVLSAVITDLTPTLPSSGSTIRMSITLANPAAGDVSNLRAQFFISTAPLVGRSQISAISTGDLLPTYRVVQRAAASGLDLSSGASTTLELTTSARELGLNAEQPGVYMFGVLLEADGLDDVRATTFLPWLPQSIGARRLGVVPIMPLSAPPQRSVDGVFLNDSLAMSLLQGGRLRSQVDAMSLVPDTTWLLDPLTLESAQAIAAGARIRNDEGVRATTDEEMAAAQQWLDDVRTITARGNTYAIPTGDLDVRAALKFGHRTLARDAVSTSASRVNAVLGTTGITTAVPVYGGSVTASTWILLREANADVAFVDDIAYTPMQRRYTPSSNYRATGFADAPVLVTDSAIANALTGNRPEAVRRQQFAAQLLMTYLEQPNKQRTIAVALPHTWVPESTGRTSDVLNAGWLQQETIADAQSVAVEDRQVVVTKATERQQRQERTLRAALAKQRMLDRLTTDPGFTRSLADAVTGVTSRWLTAPMAKDAYSNALRVELAEYAESVRVVTRGDIVFGGEQGVVPVTIANGLPVPVTVVLGASGLPSVRVSPAARTPLEINAGKRVSIELPTRVTGSGTAYLQLWLETNDGSMIGDAVILDIRSAAYARVASYLVAAAFVTLLMLIAVNTVRRIRLRRNGEQVDA